MVSLTLKLHRKIVIVPLTKMLLGNVNCTLTYYKHYHITAGIDSVTPKVLQRTAMACFRPLSTY